MLLLSLQFQLVFRANLSVANPRVFSELLGGDSGVRINVKNATEKTPDLFIAEVSRQLRELPTLDLSEKVSLKLAEKGQLSDVDNVQNDATGPHVSCKSVVSLLADNIRVHVVRRSAEDAQLFFGPDFLAETKVNDFDVLRVEFHENVVEFQVSVGVVFGVHVGHAADQLLKNVLAGVLRQPLIRLLFNMVVN